MAHNVLAGDYSGDSVRRITAQLSETQADIKGELEVDECITNQNRQRLESTLELTSRALDVLAEAAKRLPDVTRSPSPSP
ncbi:hypothetical protein ABT040_20020 [Streptomyces sp. NPDC002688]|uniref:hypothetical protein n=1 Tax=Streptomyces sp. NPDC002688 TaxID=3154423 RepID=UPI0033193E1D